MSTPAKLQMCIDASNLRAGGTVTHLVELLRAADPPSHGFERVIVYGGSAVLGKIEERPWLQKIADPLLEQSSDPFRDRRHLQRAFWQRFRLRRLARAAGCDVLFVPGGMDNSGFRPMVTMSRNMLPFDPQEAGRYGWSAAALRLLLLRWLQTRTFRSADGLVFLTGYARDTVLRATGSIRARTAVIPHGVSRRFVNPPREQRDIAAYAPESPFRLLYVSTLDVYKHQGNVVTAVAQLRAAGLPVVLDLVGPANGSALDRLNETLATLPGADVCIRYHGAVSYEELHGFYRRADLKVFASSCENMPNILVEAMAAGLPIACSSRGVMPEVLGDGGLYFDPEQPQQIADAVRTLIESPDLREQKARAAFARAQQYSWERCAGDTFAFLASRAQKG
jgi:glycosyltransferase involved in cell wall biosynthesis